MLWLVVKNASYQAVACNIHHDESKNTYQLWIERPSGKSIKLEESDDASYVNDVKEAIDFAIENRENVLRLV